MKLGTKLLTAAAIAVILTTLGAVVTVYYLSYHNRVIELREKMSSVIEQSESVATSMDYMHKHEAFDQAGLLKQASEQAAGRPLSEYYSSTALYSTIPIVAAWRSVEAAAKKNGFEFFTPTRPGVPARNPKNDYGKRFEPIFAAFARGEKEYLFHDKERQHLVLARPVHLTASCLGCHGDPAKSRTGDGKDIIGLPMENLKAGDVKGAFVLDAALSGDPVIKATVVSMTFVGGLTLIVVLIGFHVFTKRTILRPLSTTINRINGASEQTSGASTQIATASQSLAEGASEQAASLEETSASLEEMTSMVRRTADSALAAKRLTSEARHAASSGTQSNQKLHGSLDLIRHASDDMRHAVEGIKVSSANVAKIIKTIDEIAFQTNILALNAAVEAARAGEAGQGFAVVADEVRNLAQRSARAAKETAELIDASVRQSEQGVIVNERMVETIGTVAAAAVDVAKALKEIESQVAEVDSQVGQIASASNEQSTGILQINTAVTALDRVTQSNAASAEETASVCEELHAQALNLKEAIHNLKHLVDGTVQHDRILTDGRMAPRSETARGTQADSSDDSVVRSSEQHDPSSFTRTIHHGKDETQERLAHGKEPKPGNSVSF